MGGRADQLYAAVEGLVLGLGALEPGQEGMVDVDGPAPEGDARLVGKDLHVAGQDD